MDYYFSTSYFTLIPKDVYKSEDNNKYLTNLFNIGNNVIIKSLELGDSSAHMVYALPEVLNEWRDDEKQIYPLSLFFYNQIKEMGGHNKVVLSIDKRHKITHILAVQGADLKLINTYSTGDFKSALYYLFLALKMLQLNPAITHIRMYNKIDDEKMELLQRYFSSIEVCNLNCNIISVRD